MDFEAEGLLEGLSDAEARAKRIELLEHLTAAGVPLDLVATEKWLRDTGRLGRRALVPLAGQALGSGSRATHEGRTMSENVDAVKRSYEAFGRGDIEGLLAGWQDDIQWEGPNTERLPGAGTHRGKDAAAGVLGQISENWDDFRVTPDEFYEGDNTVVVLGHQEGRAKPTGTEVKLPFVHIFRLQDGKIARFQALSDTAVMADALGV